MSKLNNNLIEQFMSIYMKEYDYYDKLSSNVRLELEKSLSDAGVRAIVSSRAKDFESLRNKLIKRNSSTDHDDYRNIKDIYDDIVDLAGVRVALYFPGDMDKVSSIIHGLYEVIISKVFPDVKSEKKEGIYQKKFDGYHAVHFRIKKTDKTRYSNTPVEIQVASVLMHAWSEVEHDLVYKPLSGGISKEELMILDEINGMMISGNISLERLQTAMVERVNKQDYIFQNHYDLAAYLSQEIGVNEIVNTKDLYDFLARIGLISKESLSEVISTARNRIKKIQSDSGESVDEKELYFQDGFMMAYFVNTVVRIFPQKIIDVICQGYVPFSNLRQKMDLMTMAFMNSSYTPLAEATILAEQLAILSKDISAPSKYEIKNFDLLLELKNKNVTLEEAKAKMIEFTNGLCKIVLPEFNQESFRKLLSLAEQVVDMIQLKSFEPQSS